VTVPAGELTMTVAFLDAFERVRSGETVASEYVVIGVNRTGIPGAGTPFAVRTNVEVPEGRRVRFTLRLSVRDTIETGTPAERRSDFATDALTV